MTFTIYFLTGIEINGKKIPLEIETNETVLEAKSRLKDAVGIIDSKLIRFIYAGKELENGRCLIGSATARDGYGIGRNSTVHVLLRTAFLLVNSVHH
jgi:hypothetical protein